MSIIVSLFGMVNTVVLSVVRHESIITALIGVVLGLPLGIFLAALVTQALAGDGVSLSVPVLTLVVFVAVGALAAILPAQWAARA